MKKTDDVEARTDAQVADPRRLAAVRRLDLVDTAEEEAFDFMTRLARTLVDVPASFLSIVEADRDFYKSSAGFPAELASRRELRGRTFCHYTLGQATPLVIEDTLADPTWAAVPTVQTLGVRAYLGVPVVVDGQNVGSFCVIDTQPRQWTPTEIETVVEMCRSASREILLRDRMKDAHAKAESAAALAKRHTELLAVVAHDLRTPLQTMGLTAMVLKRVTDERAAPHLARLESATRAMTGMVDSLLATHAAGSRAVELPVVVSAARLLADAAETIAAVAERAGIQIRLGQATGSAVNVDYAAMLRVFANLLGNCIKYCPAGSTVLLEAVDAGGDVAFRVADDGPGLSAADQARAFERGWQGQAPAVGEPGAGLGLSIVRELVAKAGGQVGFDAQAARGTTVVVTLPRHDA